mmetsp:Transcript_54178/g.156563  ORF Transcript_54178/g.156563 Transcript_54178/m.156563 type:complete len:253 (+) Transcript_54178:1866-2624(+)
MASNTASTCSESTGAAFFDNSTMPGRCDFRRDALRFATSASFFARSLFCSSVSCAAADFRERGVKLLSVSRFDIMDAEGDMAGGPASGRSERNFNLTVAPVAWPPLINWYTFPFWQPGSSKLTLQLPKTSPFSPLRTPERTTEIATTPEPWRRPAFSCRRTTKSSQALFSLAVPTNSSDCTVSGAPSHLVVRTYLPGRMAAAAMPLTCPTITQTFGSEAAGNAAAGRICSVAGLTFIRSWPVVCRPRWSMRE